jgi:hemerythrin
VTDYIISLTNLYGLVHWEKVAEIYNRHHETVIDTDVLAKILVEAKPELTSHNIAIQDHYFVHEAVMEAGGFEELRLHQAGLPYYIPEPQELLKYKDELYFEQNKAYWNLKKYVRRHLVDDDEEAAEFICDEIQNICRFGFDIHAIMEELSLRNISFESEDQLHEMINLVMDLANNTRLWENNGHTLNELIEVREKPNLTVIPGGKK